MQKTLTLPSGAKLVINHVSLTAASNLKRVVARELLKVCLNLSDTLLPTLVSVAMADPTDEKARSQARMNVLASLGGTEVNSIKDALLSLIGSAEVDAAIMDCMQKWTLDGKGITLETFEPDDRRGDLYPCAVEVGKEALLPFFANLGFGSSSPGSSTKSSPG